MKLRLLALVLFFCSGACALIYEVAWTRMLTLVFGNTTFAMSTILASFMAGLALGSYLFGRFIDKKGAPLKVYGLLEIIIGVFALLFPAIAVGLTYLNVYVHRDLWPGASFYQLSGIKFVLYFTTILIPASLMGATFPIVSKFFVDRFRQLGWWIGIVYAANTLGAVAGCLATGFYLMRVLGLKETTFIAAGLNVIIGITAIAMNSRILANSATVGGRLTRRVTELAGLSPQEVQGESTGGGVAGQTASSVLDQSETPTGARESFPVSKTVAGLVLAGFFMSGFCALAYEVLWTRILVFFAGVTTYAFSAMLATFLGGLAIGSVVFARFIDRRKNILLLFAAIEILIGLTAYTSQFAIGRSELFLTIQIGEALGVARGWTDFLARLFGGAAVLMLLPTILMGASFPVVSKIYVRSLGKLGRGVGKAYSLNSIGSALGAVAVGFAIIPLLGIEKGILLVALINIGVGCVFLYLAALQNRKTENRSGFFPSSRLLVFSVAVTPLIIVALILHSFSDKTPALKKAIETALPQWPVIHYDEGATATIAVVEYSRSKSKALLIDGFNAAGTSYRYNYMRMLGHLPMLLCEKPKKVLVIAFGTGTTSGAVGMYDIERLDIVEIAKEVIKTAPLFSGLNHDILKDRRTNLIIDDGRSHVLTTDQKYDVISLEPLPPYFPGAVNLYTQDFYKLCYEKLSDTGVMCQWLPLHTQSLRDYKGLLKSFSLVFPHTSLWYFEGTTAVIGMKKELVIDFPSLRQKMLSPSVKENLREILLDDPLLLVSHFLMADETIKELISGVEPVTDDYPYVEFFSVPKRSYHFYQCVNTIEVEQWRESAFSLLAGINPDELNSVRTQLAADFNFVGNKMRRRVEGLARQAGFDGLEDVLRKAAARRPSTERVRASAAVEVASETAPIFHFHGGEKAITSRIEKGRILPVISKKEDYYLVRFASGGKSVSGWVSRDNVIPSRGLHVTVIRRSSGDQMYDRVPVFYFKDGERIPIATVEKGYTFRSHRKEGDYYLITVAAGGVKISCWVEAANVREFLGEEE